ncbi:hypothetical protein NEUTE2DRAFT_50238 [Neurospora tetrasperma FGSC 2509]|nr:hypothetical protein NEUTE2DRAFT_50238 [Neurospora tetrasperma FGSC 2509]
MGSQFCVAFLPVLLAISVARWKHAVRLLQVIAHGTIDAVRLLDKKNPSSARIPNLKTLPQQVPLKKN